MVVLACVVGYDPGLKVLQSVRQRIVFISMLKEDENVIQWEIRRIPKGRLFSTHIQHSPARNQGVCFRNELGGHQDWLNGVVKDKRLGDPH